MAKLAIVGHFEPLWLETIEKVANWGKFGQCTPPPNFEIWPKMSRFGGKRLEKLQIG